MEPERKETHAERNLTWEWDLWGPRLVLQRLQEMLWDCKAQAGADHNHLEHSNIST